MTYGRGSQIDRVLAQEPEAWSAHFLLGGRWPPTTRYGRRMRTGTDSTEGRIDCSCAPGNARQSRLSLD
jgi:hypothetical protein